MFDQSGIGQTVQEQILAEYPQDLLADHHRLSDLVMELVQRYNEDLVVHVIDPQSLQGIFKSLRYRLRHYPAFIIDEQETVVGWDREALERALASRPARTTTKG